MPPLLRSIVATCCLSVLAMDVAISESPSWPFEDQQGQFLIHSDFDTSRDQRIEQQLGSLKEDLAKTLGLRIHPEPVHIILFSKQGNYQAYMAQYFPNIPFRRALFIKRRGPGMVFGFFSPEMYVDLRHEATHSLLNASLPYVPLWLDEGLAEYFESTPGDKSDRPHPHRGAIERRAFWRSVPEIQSLEAIDDLSKMGNKEYQNAWSWVHFLLHESEQSRGILLGFLSDLQAHSPPGQLSRRVAAEMPEWKQRYLKYFRR